MRDIMQNADPITILFISVTTAAIIFGLILAVGALAMQVIMKKLPDNLDEEGREMHDEFLNR